MCTDPNAPETPIMAGKGEAFWFPVHSSSNIAISPDSVRKRWALSFLFGFLAKLNVSKKYIAISPESVRRVGGEIDLRFGLRERGTAQYSTTSQRKSSLFH